MLPERARQRPVAVSRRAAVRFGTLAAAGLMMGGAVQAARSRALHLRGGGSHPAPTAAWGPKAAASAGARLVALIANSLGNTLTVVDPRALEPIGTLPVGREPHKFRQSLDGRTVFSCNTTSNELIELDLATLRPLRRIRITDPYNVAFTRDGRFLYTLAYRYSFVEVHDGRTFQRLTRIETGRSPSHFAFSPDGRWMANSNQHAHTVTVLDTDRMVLVRRLRVDPLPAGLQVSADGRYLFVASGGAGTISVFDTERWQLAKRLQSGRDAHEMAATRDGGTIFVTNRGENTITVFDVARQAVAARFPVAGGPDMPVLTPDGAQLWVSGRYADTASVVDVPSLRVLATFPTGKSPHGIYLGEAKG
jgi:YVTN family beta-propeller protein